MSIVLAFDRKLPLILLNVSHQILNRTHLDPPLLAKLEAVISPHHAPSHELCLALNLLPIGNQLADDTNVAFASQATQIDSRLGMASSHSDTALSRLQWQNVSRSPEVARFRGGVSQHVARARSVGRGYARRRVGVCGVNAHSIGRLIGVRILRHHLREVQGCGARDGEGRADVAG